MTENYVNIYLNTNDYTQYYWKVPKRTVEVDFIIMKEGKILVLKME